MNTQNAETIYGPLDRIYNLAARVEDWPAILPHYRKVEVLSGDEKSRVVYMHCIRAFGPIDYSCRWQARQELLPEERRILFTHLAGPAQGMEVEWRIEPVDKGVMATITHRLQHPLGAIYSDRIVGPLFVEAIAGQTLKSLKALVESEDKA